MNMVLNEQEQAKQELMHFGTRGMRWGIRKADTRLGLHVGVRSPSLVPGAKAVRKAHASKLEKGNDRFEKYIQSQHDRYKGFDKALRTQLKDIKSGPGSRWEKFKASMRAQTDANAKFHYNSQKVKNKYIDHERERNQRVKAKQDAFSNSLKAQMEAEIKTATSQGNILNKLFSPAKIEMKFTKMLVEGMAKIDQEED